MRSGNPALNNNTFLDIGSGELVTRNPGEVMTLNGTVNKTGFMLLLLVATAAYTWSLYTPENPGAVMPWLLVGGIGGFIVALVTVFKKTWAPVTAPLYAPLEGLFVGGNSAMIEARKPDRVA